MLYVLVHSSAHWPKTLAVGAVLSVAAGLCFAVYFRFASALVRHRTLVRRMRVAASTEPSGALVDPLEEEELALEEQFAEMDRRDRT